MTYQIETCHFLNQALDIIRARTGWLSVRIMRLSGLVSQWGSIIKSQVGTLPDMTLDVVRT